MKYLILIILLSSVGYSQSLHIFDIDTTDFPTMRAKFYAFDEDGNQITNLSPSDFELSENGQLRTITNISCPPPPPPKALSTVLVIDISGSMSSGNLTLAKSAANSWVNALPNESECAITSFDNNNYLNQDFTNDKSKLLNSITKLISNGGTDYNAALLDSMSGGLQISLKGKFKKVIVFITDGLSNYPKQNEIIAEAKNQDCVIYCVTLGMNCPLFLKYISSQTGGQFFENVTTVEQAKNVYHQILQIEQGIEPCMLEWQTTSSCIAGNTNAEITLLQNGLKTNIYYDIPNSKLINLSFNPQFIRFQDPQIGVKESKIVKVTARNSRFNVSDIILSDPRFTLTPSNFLLEPNKSIDITISYTAQDSNYRFCKIDFVNDICKQNYYATGGYIGIKPKLQFLNLTHPNGGEELVAGSDSIITWSGISPTDTVKLEYSINNGLTWKSITEKATGLMYKWKNIPRPQSQKCLVRILLNNTSDTESLNKPILTLKGHTWEVRSISFSQNGEILVSSGRDNTIRIWDIKTGQNLKTINVKENITNSIVTSPDNKTFATAGIDSTIKIWDILSGNELKTLIGHNGRINKIDYNFDGSLLASASSDSTIKIWDVKTGLLLKTLIGHTKSVYYVSFNSDGSMLASTSDDDKVKIWDVFAGQLIKNLNWYYGPASSVEFSPDDINLAISAFSSFRIFDFNTGWEIPSSIGGHKGSIYMATYSPDGRLLATGSADRTVKLWNSNSYAEIIKLIGHTDNVYSVDFSPDGSLIASGSGDRTIKIWSTDVKYLQDDVSDNVFSIVAPEATSIDIDMGQILVNDIKDSVVSGFISNIGTYPFTVDSIYFSGADANAFSLVSGIPEYNVEPNTSHFGEFRFSPKRVGLHNAKLVVFTQSDTLIKSIIGVGIEQKIAVLENFIDFGQVILGKYKDTLNIVTIKNIGTTPFVITDTKHTYPNDIDFTTISGGGSFTLQADEIKTMELRFTPSDIGRTSGMLEFHYDGIGSPAVIQLFGEGIKHEIAVVENIIDFGQVNMGDYKDTLNVVTIKNIGTVPFIIKDTKYTNLNDIDFTTISGDGSFTLQPDETKTMVLRFTPSNVGKTSGMLEFHYDGVGSPAVIQLFGEGIKHEIAVLDNIIDFGQVYLGEFKDTLNAVTIKNIGTSPFIITDTKHTYPNDIDFSTLAGGGSFTLQADETKTMELRFTPSDLGRTSGMLEFHYDGIGSPAVIQLFGEGIDSSPASLKLETIQLEAYAGQEIEIPILITEQENLLAKGIKTISTELIFNPTLLLPLDYAVEMIDNTTAKINIDDLHISSETIQTLKTIKCKVGLGNAEECELILGNSVANEGDADITIVNGNFKLLGICYEGGTRLINPNSNISIKTLAPNPAQNKLEINLSLIEKGKTELLIYNIYGEKVNEILNDEVSDTGDKIYNVNISSLPSGNYFVVLITPTYTEKKKFIIQR